MSLYIPKELEEISKELNSKGKRAILVGGSVRDYFLGFSIKDYDIEVFGVEKIEELERILNQFGDVNLVGKSFGVLKLKIKEFEFDFSMPREEKKVSRGHRGFIIDLKRDISFKEATQRRDFTVNAIGFDILSKEFLDPQNGIVDIKKRVLKNIDNKRFQEDPLRVYRGIQFLARFNLKIDNKTFKLCLDMVNQKKLDELPKERVYIEIKKLLLKSKKPSIGIKLMERLNILKIYFPELLNIDLKAIDKISKYKNLKLIFATIGFYNKKYKIEFFLRKLTNEKRLIDEVIKLTNTIKEYHKKQKWKIEDIKELSTRVKINEFLKIYKIVSNSSKNYRYIKKIAKKIDIYNSPLKPLIVGKDLINLGLKPSKEFSKILNNIYKAQIKGEITSYNNAIEYIKKNI